MKIALRLGVTDKSAVTGTADSFTQTGPSNAAIVYATVDCHLAMLSDAATDDFFLKAGTYFVAHLDPEETLSYIKATGALDGTIYITAAD